MAKTNDSHRIAHFGDLHLVEEDEEFDWVLHMVDHARELARITARSRETSWTRRNSTSSPRFCAPFESTASVQAT